MKRVKTIIAGISLIMAFSLMSPDTKAQVLDFYGSTNYSIAIPMGSTADYISNTSFRGVSFEFGRFINDDVSAGFLFSWNVFNENFPKQVYQLENGIDLYGKRYNYINAFPLMGTGRYHFMRGAIVRPYAGGGIGAIIINRSTDMGLYRDQLKKWQFGLAPEAGIMIKIGSEANFNLGARYSYAFKSGEATSHAWLSIQAGITFIY
jgi:hypothetical protein